jgi:hypothetical protein
VKAYFTAKGDRKTMKFFLALTSTKPNAPFSVKALLYAVLCTLFGTAWCYCCLSAMLMSGNWLGNNGEHPYELPAMGIVWMIVTLLWCAVGILWFCTVGAARRKWLNALIAVGVAVVGFIPSLWLTITLHGWGWKIGRIILYEYIL